MDIDRFLKDMKYVMAKVPTISHPAHYVCDRTYEPRKVIEDWGLNFYLGNALKYISRANRKGDAEENLLKAIQNIIYELERLKKWDDITSNNKEESK